MIKMQHPDYEVYTKGIHHYRNVSCADCHMPYRTEGGRKFTDHHIQSPLNNIANSCAVCHRWGEEEIRSRVEGIQDKVAEGRHRAEAALRFAHFDAAACIQLGASDQELTPVRDRIRRAQMRWDYVAANNGMGFHAPQECQRILAAATDLAQQARLEAQRVLARKGFTGEVVYPDVATKEKAQAVNKAFSDGTPPRLLPEGVGIVPWPAATPPAPGPVVTPGAASTPVTPPAR
jgi:nitrite reductase (cytochrome c-552)